MGNPGPASLAKSVGRSVLLLLRPGGFCGEDLLVKTSWRKPSGEDPPWRRPPGEDPLAKTPCGMVSGRLLEPESKVGVTASGSSCFSHVDACMYISAGSIARPSGSLVPRRVESAYPNDRVKVGKQRHYLLPPDQRWEGSSVYLFAHTPVFEFPEQKENTPSQKKKGESGARVPRRTPSIEKR